MDQPEVKANQMTFWEHLEELRVRIFRVLFAIVGAFAFTYSFPFGLQDLHNKEILGFHPFSIFKGMDAFRFTLWKVVQHPFLEAMARQTKTPVADLHPWAYNSLTEPFFSLMRLSLWGAAFLAAPMVFYQVWSFIRPGLHLKERRMALPFVFITSGCFLAGVLFAYSQAFKFLGDILFQEAASAGLRANLHMDEYLDLFLGTVLMTGLMFELPVLFFFLAKFRLVTAKWMLKYWRHATVAIVTFSAFFTPGDVVATTIFFSIILLALYFVSVGVVWLAQPKQAKESAE